MLDADHAGLEDVKDRITEYIAVRKLRTGARHRGDGQGSGAILTLIGPPGTGKTSIGESIARATGREFVACRSAASATRPRSAATAARTSARCPGRLVRALRDAGTMNPVILLDEVDKVGADWRGDPSRRCSRSSTRRRTTRSATTTSTSRSTSSRSCSSPRPTADTIPGPLLDRMEVIRFDGYTVDEKVAIARDYLWPRQRERNGLLEDEVDVTDECCGRSSSSTRARPASASSSASSGRCCASPRRGSQRRGRGSPRSRAATTTVGARRARPPEGVPGGRRAYRRPLDTEVRKLPELLRLSPHYYNTEAELDRAVEVVAGL